jgi:NTP pyrophosphatase (non-canonical NTP hydrolase)
VLSAVSDMIAFHLKFGLGNAPKPTGINYQLRQYRIERIQEECGELVDAINTGDLKKIAREGIDVLMVVLGTLLVYGLPIVPTWVAVQKANMAKTAVKVDTDTTKPVKGPDWVSPDDEIVAAIESSLLSDEPANALLDDEDLQPDLADTLQAVANNPDVAKAVEQAVNDSHHKTAQGQNPPLVAAAPAPAAPPPPHEDEPVEEVAVAQEPKAS